MKEVANKSFERINIRGKNVDSNQLITYCMLCSMENHTMVHHYLAVGPVGVELKDFSVLVKFAKGLFSPVIIVQGGMNVTVLVILLAITWKKC